MAGREELTSGPPSCATEEECLYGQAANAAVRTRSFSMKSIRGFWFRLRRQKAQSFGLQHPKPYPLAANLPETLQNWKPGSPSPLQPWAGHVWEALRCPFGNYVLQKCIQVGTVLSAQGVSDGSSAGRPLCLSLDLRLWACVT